MTIYDEDESSNIIVLYDSRWRYPETLGFRKSDPEYAKLQSLWEQVTGKTIPEEEKENGNECTN